MLEHLTKIAKKLIPISICIAIGLFSFLIISKHTTSVDTWSSTIEYLEAKKATVMELTLTSTAASAALSSLPGDAATPIATKLVDLSTYFLIILSAIYLEKYLLTILSFASFKILIPIACILLIAYVLWKFEILKNLAIKFFVFGLAIFLIIPSSVEVSKMIEHTYESSSQIHVEEIKPNEETNDETKDDKNWFESLISSAEDSIEDITNGISDTVTQAKEILNNLIEALAVMIVTSCIIPILVFIFFGWIVKLIFNINFNFDVKRKKSN